MAMRKTAIFLSLMLAAFPVLSQTFQITFTGSGKTTIIEHLMVSNLSTGESLVMPGDQTLELQVESSGIDLQEDLFSGQVFPNPFQKPH